MKHYRIPAIALLVVSAALLLFTLKSIERTRRAGADLVDARRALDRSRRNLLDSERAANEAKQSGAPIEEFLGNWTREITAEASIEQIFSQLDTLAVDNLLSPSGRNFTTNANYLFDGRKIPVESVNITVAGDFYRTLNWLGAVEAAFPLARVEEISYVANDTSLSLSIELTFPRKFDVDSSP
jgi:hypothetical protein